MHTGLQDCHDPFSLLYLQPEGAEGQVPEETGRVQQTLH